MTPLCELFAEYYGQPPRWIARAPGRVNLIGEHTDYNDGYVLPMAIDRYTFVLAAPNGSGVMNWRSTAMKDVVGIGLGQVGAAGPRAHWSNYPRGVVAGVLNAGHVLHGFDALVHSTVPVGGGLSSSAALEVATATLLEAMLGERFDPIRKALLCQTAEHDFAGVPCGLMDQLIVTLGLEGHLLLLDCRSREVEHIPFADPSVCVLIIDSNVRHELASSEYGRRRAECVEAAARLKVDSLRSLTRTQLEQAAHTLDSVLLRRARHVVRENDRTTRMATRLRRRDWLGAGLLMYASHESLRADYEVSCPELDAIVEIAQNIGPRGGVYGCRMTGGGFGGCAVALIDASAEPRITHTLTCEYRELTGMAPTILSSRPARGACVIEAPECLDLVPS